MIRSMIMLFLILMTIMGNEKYRIVKVKNLKEIISEDNRNIFEYDVQLPNNCFAYYLSDDKVIVLPNSLKDNHMGIFFLEKRSFDKAIIEDKLPIDNPSKTFFELEIEIIREINKNIDYYQSWLNEQFNGNYKEVDINILNFYYRNLKQKQSNSKLAPKDYVAFATLVTQHLLKSDNTKWGLYKKYGQYNPYYEPCILYGDDMINFIFPRIWKYIDSDFESFDGFFKVYKVLPNNRNIHDFQKKMNDGVIVSLD